MVEFSTGDRWRKSLESELRRLGCSKVARFDLARAALLIGALDRPLAKLESYLAHLDEIAFEVGRAAGGLGEQAPLAVRCGAIAAAIFGKLGYRGDTTNYDDLANARIAAVIDRRRGLPVSLAILCLHGARAQGWQANGIGFPGHFLIQLEHAGERSVLDPFNGATTLAPGDLQEMIRHQQGPGATLKREHYRPVDDRAILLRLQENLKIRHLMAGRASEALRILEIMLMLKPSCPRLWREAGMLNVRLGNLRAAVMALEQFLELDQSRRVRNETVALVREIREKLG